MFYMDIKCCKIVFDYICSGIVFKILFFCEYWNIVNICYIICIYWFYVIIRFCEYSSLIIFFYF